MTIDDVSFIHCMQETNSGLIELYLISFSGQTVSLPSQVNQLRSSGLTSEVVKLNFLIKKQKHIEHCEWTQDEQKASYHIYLFNGFKCSWVFSLRPCAAPHPLQKREERGSIMVEYQQLNLNKVVGNCGIYLALNTALNLDWQKCASSAG